MSEKTDLYPCLCVYDHIQNTHTYIHACIYTFTSKMGKQNCLRISIVVLEKERAVRFGVLKKPN